MVTAQLTSQQAIRLTHDNGRNYQHYHVGCYQDNAQPMPVSEIADNAVCEECKLPIHPQPFAIREIVEIKPSYVSRYGGALPHRYLMVLNIYWCNQQWVIDTAQGMRPYAYGPDGEPYSMALSPTMFYMIPADCVQKITCCRYVGDLVSVTVSSPPRQRKPRCKNTQKKVEVVDTQDDLDNHPFC